MNNPSHGDCSRRLFIRNSGAMLAAAAAAQPLALIAGVRAAEWEDETTVSAAENLMRHHGILDRMLMIYEAAIDQPATGRKISAKVLTRVTELLKSFIQDFHEKLEEELIFPITQKTEKLSDLVNELLRQHQDGRIQMEHIIRIVGSRAGLENGENRQELLSALRVFVQMYRPHKAREDTELFPALYQFVPPDILNSLADMVEEKEWEIFGEDAFARIVEEVASIEGMVGIREIAQFTPSSSKSINGQRALSR